MHHDDVDEPLSFTKVTATLEAKDSARTPRPRRRSKPHSRYACPQRWRGVSSDGQGIGRHDDADGGLDAGGDVSPPLFAPATQPLPHELRFSIMPASVAAQRSTLAAVLFVQARRQVRALGPELCSAARATASGSHCRCQYCTVLLA